MYTISMFHFAVVSIIDTSISNRPRIESRRLVDNASLL